MSGPLDQADPAGDAAEAALAGRLVVIPTDTVYGIGTRPDLPEATARIFEAKRRPSGVTLPVLVATRDAAEAVGEIGEDGRRLCETFWPGPLTLVVRRTERSSAWDLGGARGTIGLRMPAHAVAIDVLERTGPLAVTSANLSGEPTPATCGEVRAVFGDEVAAYVCDDRPLVARPSTVVDLSGAQPRILREGALSAGEVLGVL